MSVIPWEEPAEDLTEHPAVIYEDGRPVCWLNHAPSELLADPEWTLYHPDMSTGDQGPFTHIFTNAASWKTEAPHDPLGDVRRAWDLLVDDYLTGTLRRAR